jgi:hypothetical protein
LSRRSSRTFIHSCEVPLTFRPSTDGRRHCSHTQPERTKKRSLHVVSAERQRNQNPFVFVVRQACVDSIAAVASTFTATGFCRCCVRMWSGGKQRSNGKRACAVGMHPGSMQSHRRPLHAIGRCRRAIGRAVESPRARMQWLLVVVGHRRQRHAPLMPVRSNRTHA